MAWIQTRLTDQIQTKFRPDSDQIQTRFRPDSDQIQTRLLGRKPYFYRVFCPKFGLNLVWIWSESGLNLVWIWSESGLNLVWIWSEFGLNLVWIWSELVWIFRPFSGQIQTKFRLNLADLGLNSKKENTRKNKKVNNFLGSENYLLFCLPKLSLSGQKASYTTKQA